MKPEPREGVDYVVDLYAIAGAERDDPPEAIGEKIKARSMEYHPDRLQGVAPEFRERGQLVMRLLSRAKSTLLDGARRSKYDKILEAWDGPVSTDGTPVMTMDRYLQHQLADKTPEEVEAVVDEQIQGVRSILGYSPQRLGFVQGLIDETSEPGEALRREYEDALLQEDNASLVEVVKRAEVIGVSNVYGDQVVTDGYVAEIEQQIHEARRTRTADRAMQALGGVSAQLALLAGESPEAEAAVESSASANSPRELPAYFEDQASKLVAAAQARRNIVNLRLESFEPDYPGSDMQQEFRSKVIVGVVGSVWFGVDIDPETSHAEGFDLPKEVREALAADNLKAVVELGYGIITYKLLDRIDMYELLGVALGKYVSKYSKKT